MTQMHLQLLCHVALGSLCNLQLLFSVCVDARSVLRPPVAPLPIGLCGINMLPKRS